MKRYVLSLILAGLSASAGLAQSAPIDAKVKSELDAARAELARAKAIIAEMERRLAQKDAETDLRFAREIAEKVKADAALRQMLASQVAAEAERKARAEADYGRKMAEAARQSLTEQPKPKDDVLKPVPAEGKPLQLRGQVFPRLELATPPVVRDVLIGRPETRTLGLALAADAGATSLVRRTHAVTREKAEKLMVFFKEFAGEGVLEAKFDKGGLVTTASPEIDRLVVGLVALMNGKKPAKVGANSSTQPTDVSNSEVFKLRNVSADDAAISLRSFFGDQQVRREGAAICPAQFLPDPASNSVLIYGQIDVINCAADILERLDAPPPEKK